MATKWNTWRKDHHQHQNEYKMTNRSGAINAASRRLLFECLAVDAASFSWFAKTE